MASTRAAKHGTCPTPRHHGPEKIYHMQASSSLHEFADCDRHFSPTRAVFLPRVTRYSCCCYCSAGSLSAHKASSPMFPRLIMCVPARMCHIVLVRCVRIILAQYVQCLGEWMSSTHTQATSTDWVTLRSVDDTIGWNRRLCSATTRQCTPHGVERGNHPHRYTEGSKGSGRKVSATLRAVPGERLYEEPHALGMNALLSVSHRSS